MKQVHGSWLSAGVLLIALSGCNAVLGADEEGAEQDGGDGGSATDPYAFFSGDGDSLFDGGTVGDGDAVGGDGDGGVDEPEVVELDEGLEIRGSPRHYRVVRLTHDQWENSVRDVLGLAERPDKSSGFLPDPPDGKFSNNERALYVTDTLRLDYERSAQEIAEEVAANPTLLSSYGADAASVIQTLGRRAFRRALTGEEIGRYQALWALGPGYLQSGDDFADGARIFIEALLQSPNFLYRVQLSEDGARLSGMELATKLSFLLRNTTPDDDLLNAAESGALDTDESLASVAAQMIEETGAVDVMRRFHAELFQTFRYNSITKDPARFPNYDESMNAVLQEADELFFSHLYQTGGGLRAILTSDVAFVNDSIAPIYGLPGPGPELTQVQVPDRPGYLTRAGFLAYNANLTLPDPIHRGVDINNKLMCAHMEPPAGEIPPLPPLQPGQTNRQRVAAHTEQGVCAGCHGDIINPPGFALESYDGLGQLQTEDNGNPIDTAGTYGLLSGEQSFQDIRDLTTLLAGSFRVHACYAAHVTEFAFARDIGQAESELLEGLGEQSLTSDTSMKNLLLAVVTSPRFSTSTSGTP